MDTEEKYGEKLAHYVIVILSLAAITAVVVVFRKVIGYVLLAGVVACIGTPLYSLLGKIRIRRKPLPGWLLSLSTLVIMLLVVVLLLGRMIPMVSGLFEDLTLLDTDIVSMSISQPMANLDQWLIDSFQLPNDFRLETVLLEKLQGLMDLSQVPQIVGAVASGMVSVAIAVFSIVFISFFFLKDPGLLSDIICAFVPDRMETEMRQSLNKISGLLTRYFSGLVLEMFGVGLLNFLGMWLIARIGVHGAMAIGLITGLLNVIPYVGPCIGYVVGIGIGVLLKYGMGVGIAVNFPLFILVLLAVMLFTQMIDVFVYQPVIYSNSIQASALEVFIVLLMAGFLTGVGGMIVAIPCYTVIRVIAGRFLRKVKFIRKLVPDVADDIPDE